jgi:hypothetical protein
MGKDRLARLKLRLWVTFFMFLQRYFLIFSAIAQFRRRNTERSPLQMLHDWRGDHSA